MIEVFKTNVRSRKQADHIIGLLQHNFSQVRVNVDLHDCDKVLRVAGIKPGDTEKVICELNRLGFTCEILN